MTFLVVEDNLNMQKTIERMILRYFRNGIQSIAFCEDGDRALELYKTCKPDWVLMDIQLKSTDGLMATRNILMTDPEAKIVIVTQFTDEPYRVAARNVGAFGFIQKDNLYELIDVLDANG